jgi:hypothetical protein
MNKIIKEGEVTEEFSCNTEGFVARLQQTLN